MTLILTLPPVAEPLSLAELKAHLRIEHAGEDELLSSLIATARSHLESATGLALLSQGWRLLLDDWPEDPVIQICKAPVRTIDDVVVYDAGGQPQSIPAQDILLDIAARPARLIVKERPLPGQPINGIEIDFTSGFGNAAEVPPELRRAMLIHAAYMHEFRGAVSPDMQPAGIPAGYERLIAPWIRRAL